MGGIVVMRYGENALNVIEGVKKKLEAIKGSLPEGVKVVPTYDRSTLIKNSISTLRWKLIEESIVVALVCVVFLWHLRSAFVAIITLPIAIILSFLPMLKLDLTSNIMSLGGIAIAIGAMVDSAIIMVENAHKFLEHFREENGREPNGKERVTTVIAAAKSVGRPLSFSLLVITVSSHSRLLARSAGRPALQAARLYEDVRDAVFGDLVHHLRAGHARFSHPRPHLPGAEAPGSTLHHQSLQTVRVRGLAPAEVDHRHRVAGPALSRPAGAPARARVPCRP